MMENTPWKMGTATEPNWRIASPLCWIRPKNCWSPDCASAVWRKAANCPVACSKMLSSVAPCAAPAPNTVTRIEPMLPTVRTSVPRMALLPSRKVVNCPDAATPSRAAERSTRPSP